MKLVWKYGHEAVCPSCGHQNACLYDGRTTEGEEKYKCRDCGKVYAMLTKPVEVGKDYILGRGIFEAECKEVPK